MNILFHFLYIATLVTSSQALVGGDRTAFDQVQIHVLIYKEQEVDSPEKTCGGVIIDRKWILTSAECVSDPDFPQKTKVYLGVDDMDNYEDFGIEVKDVHFHPEWRPEVALISTKQDLLRTHPKSSQIDLIKMATVYNLEWVYLYGLGAEGANYEGSGILRSCSTKIWNVQPNINFDEYGNDTCLYLYDILSYNPNIHFCIGHNVGFKRMNTQCLPCYGDEGSPVVTQAEDGSLVLAGILTRNSEWCDEPGVASRVTIDMKLWIKRTMLQATQVTPPPVQRGPFRLPLRG